METCIGTPCPGRCWPRASSPTAGSARSPRPLDLCSFFVLILGYDLLLRKQRAQDRIEGREPLDWSEDDYGDDYRRGAQGDLGFGLPEAPMDGFSTQERARLG